MFQDSQQIRAEKYTEIGVLLQDNAAAIVEAWSDRAIQEQPNAKRVHHAVLLDHFHEFLRTLGRSLAESDDAKISQHCESASSHGEQRWEAGWSLPEVVRDYQLLRLVVLDFLEDSLERRLARQEILAIGLALDEAISASIVAYAQDRDEYIKDMEAAKAEELQKVNQRLQKHADALLDADKRKNEFLAMLAHELRNPLAPVRNAVEILRLKGPADASTEWARELIDRQMQQLTRMVDDLLDVSRITRGKVSVEKQPLYIGTIVERSAEEVRPFCDAHKHQLTVALPPGPLWVVADPTRLTQVLVNLLHNAIKFTDDGGKIFLTVQEAGAEVTISVRDTGVGIPEELLPHIFDPFMQEDRLQSRNKGGLGLGLALVRSLLDLHGGRVTAFSAGKGAGSEFVVHLPRLDAAPSLQNEVRKTFSQDKAKACRVLVVDDNADAAQSLKILLEWFGHEVQVAATGKEALDSASAFLPQVVLLDIGLPGMDGFEVARRLRLNPALQETLLVAVTGYGQDEDRRQSQQAGFSAHLVKPLELSALQEVLASFLHRETSEQGQGD